MMHNNKAGKVFQNQFKSTKSGVVVKSLNNILSLLQKLITVLANTTSNNFGPHMLYTFEHPVGYYSELLDVGFCCKFWMPLHDV